MSKRLQKKKAFAPAPAEEVKVEEPKKGGALPPPFLGWPQVEKYHLDFRRPDDELVAYFKFAAAYAAKRFLIEIVGSSDEWELVDDETIRLDHNLLVRCDHAKELFEKKLTKAEMDWVLSIPYPTYAATIAGRHIDRSTAVNMTQEATKEVHKAERREARAQPKDVPPSKLLRIAAKAMSLKAHGTKDRWREFKAQAEAQLKAGG